MSTNDQFLIDHGDLATLHWMARRYADGRQSTATSTFNEITRRLLAAGVELGKVDGTPWARDGGGRRYDGLTEIEAVLGREPDYLCDSTEHRIEELTDEVARLKAKGESLRKASCRLRDYMLARVGPIVDVPDEIFEPFMAALDGKDTPADTIYEVVDASDEEQYYTLGVYTDPAKALSLLDGAEPPYNEDAESATIEVRGRKLGFNPHRYWVIAKRTWVRVNDDDAGTPWLAHPIETPCPVKEGA